MDVFPSRRSANLVAVTHPGKYDPFESLMIQGRILAFISFMDIATHRIFHQQVDDWTGNKISVDNFRRTVLESKKTNFFDPKSVRWSKVCKKLKANPNNERKNSDQRMNFKVDNMLLVKQLFSFGLWTVALGEGHVFQTTDVPILIYHLPEKSMECRPRPRTLRRNLVEQDQVLYDRYVLRPNSTYVVPPGINYLVLTVQKTLFAVDVMAWEDVKHFPDFRTHKNYSLNVYNLPPPTPAHEMQAPPMVMPEERRQAKRPRLSESSPEPRPRIVPERRERIVPEPRQRIVPERRERIVPEPRPRIVPDPQPRIVPEPAGMASMPFIVPGAYMVPEPVEIFPEPEEMVPEPFPAPETVPEDYQEVDHILSNDIGQDCILTFLKEFERDVCASFAAEPAHQIQLDGPNLHQPQSVAATFPPPPDNYWGPNDVGNCGLLDNDLDTFHQEEPMDLVINSTVSTSKKTHVFTSGTIGALDLRNR